MVFKKPIRVVLEKHETEHVWNGMVIGSLWGQCPLGCVQWLLRSRGAKLVQACPCSLSGGVPALKQSWALPGIALGMAGEHTQQCWVLRLSVLSLSCCPLLFGRAFVLRKSAKARKDHIALSFLSALQICIFQTATFSQRGSMESCFQLLTKTGSTCDQQEETCFSRGLVWSSVKYC